MYVTFNRDCSTTKQQGSKTVGQVRSRRLVENYVEVHTVRCIVMIIN